MNFENTIEIIQAWREYLSRDIIYLKLNYKIVQRVLNKRVSQ